MNSVVKYFNEEKKKSYIFIIIESLLSQWLSILCIKDFFLKGIAIPFIIVALLSLS
jgi:hypothetical protein